ncbi:B3 domain-containing protein [Dichanthelium oligosanthes]|uniref:B3 domain-containing protein n=1 Tax=Dichanthelium oligosanthes TaxID=888268 RepID=A0A1E5VTB8_9POAL|nr:B3 domain-containing protein [Dichanthelium oligosanthes]
MASNAALKGKSAVVSSSAAEKSGEATGSPAAAEGVQPRMLPLMGKPYFTCIMCKSHVYAPFQVVVPRSLAPFLPAATVPAAVTWRGRTWEMRFTGGRQIQRLEAGWRGFALDNGLRLGDGCILELVEGGGGAEGEGGGAVVFRAQVLRADIPAAIRDRAGGYTSSSPILID